MRFYGTENLALFTAHHRKDRSGIDEDQILDHPIFLNDENAVRFFDYHGLFKVNNEDFYDMYMKSQVKND